MDQKTKKKKKTKREEEKKEKEEEEEQGQDASAVAALPAPASAPTASAVAVTLPAPASAPTASASAVTLPAQVSAAAASHDPAPAASAGAETLPAAPSKRKKPKTGREALKEAARGKKARKEKKVKRVKKEKKTKRKEEKKKKKNTKREEEKKEPTASAVAVTVPAQASAAAASQEPAPAAPAVAETLPAPEKKEEKAAKEEKPVDAAAPAGAQHAVSLEGSGSSYYSSEGEDDSNSNGSEASPAPPAPEGRRKGASNRESPRRSRSDSRSHSRRHRKSRSDSREHASRSRSQSQRSRSSEAQRRRKDHRSPALPPTGSGGSASTAVAEIREIDNLFFASYVFTESAYAPDVLGLLEKSPAHVCVVTVRGPHEVFEEFLEGLALQQQETDLSPEKRDKLLLTKQVYRLWAGGYLVCHSYFVASAEVLREDELHFAKPDESQALGHNFGVAKIHLKKPQPAVAVGVMNCPPSENGLPSEMIGMMRDRISKRNIRLLAGVFPKDLSGDFFNMCWEEGAACNPFTQPFRGRNGLLYAWPHQIIAFGPTEDFA